MIHIDNVSVKNYDYFRYKCGEIELVHKFKFKYLFDSVRAYGVGSHRHMAEIDQELSKISKKKDLISPQWLRNIKVKRKFWKFYFYNHSNDKRSQNKQNKLNKCFNFVNTKFT